MAGIRANFQPLMDPVIRTLFFDRYKELSQVMPMVFQVETSSRNKETDSAIAGFGMMQATGELENINYDDPIKMYSTTYEHGKYTMGFKVSQELKEDDQHNVIKQFPRALAKSVIYTTEYLGASVLNNGFDTSYTSYGDAKPLFSTLHPRADGGTAQSNASSTSIPLTEENTRTARLAFQKILDDRGNITTMMPNRLLIPVDLEDTANIINGSTNRPGTANNDINVYKGMFDIVSWRYLTSTTAWYLMDKNDHLLKWFWRIRPEFKSDYVFNTEADTYKVRARFSYGWSDWRGTWGSKGDASSYSS